MGYLAAVFLHGVYDTCAMTGTTAAVVFVGFIVAMYGTVYRLIKRESAADNPV